MINYRARQKITSFVCIFTLLFSQTFQIAFFSQASADDSTYRDLVSIIVDKDIYNDSLSQQIQRYSQDIQSVYPGTQFVVFPVEANISPQKIALLNEKLYTEGDGVHPGRLIGTILVGDVTLPVVHDNSNAYLSVYPYTDFVNKKFIYNDTKSYFVKSENTSGSNRPEIWHSIVSPNTGNKIENTQKISQYFNKLHDFYAKQGAYQGNAPEPFVFYYDGKWEELASKVAFWKMYQKGRSISEELVYNRYSRDLAENTYALFQQYLNEEITGSSGSVSTGALIDASGADLVSNYIKEQSLIYGTSALSVNSTDMFSGMSDILSKKVVDAVIKPFYGIFNENFLGNILKYVHNAGRYNRGSSSVNVDIPSVIVSKQDVFFTQVKQEANTYFEEKINQLVKNGLSQKIALLTGYTAPSTTSWGGSEVIINNTYSNYFYGKKASGITKANECSIVRGSSLPVEANRGYNINNTASDANILSGEGPQCALGTSLNTFSYWGGNSPLNLNLSENITSLRTASLKGNRYNKFTKSIFDIAGSRQISLGNGLSVATPDDCSHNDLILDSSINGCNAANTSLAFTAPFGELYSGNGLLSGGYSCEIHTLNLDGKEVKGIQKGSCSSGGGSDGGGSETPMPFLYTFKSIPSDIVHTSPTIDEFEAEKSNIATPSLGADKDRYVDFVSAKGNTKKIMYPNVFRVNFAVNEDINEDTVKAKIKQFLDEKSNEINGLIAQERPSGLNANQQAVSALLSTGGYPTTTVDLYKDLEGNSSLFKTLVKSVLWDSQKYPTEKYASIFESHLNWDARNDKENVGHRGLYEIATLGGEGDAANMFVGFDPESKDVSADLQDISTKSAAMEGFISGAQTIDSQNENGDDSKCGPADGVMIWQWVPAIFCWMKSFLPPKITSGQCNGWDGGANSYRDSRPTQVLEDKNQNGVIDVAEEVGKGKIELSTSQNIAGFSSTFPLTATMLDSAGKVIEQDNYNVAHFALKQLKVYTGSLNSWDGQIVYDATQAGTDLARIQNINPYLTFTPADIRVSSGSAVYNFSTHLINVDATFEVSVKQADKNGEVILNKNSNNLLVRVRDIPQGLVAKTKISEQADYGVSQSIDALNPYGIMFDLMQTEEAVNFSRLNVYNDVTGTEVVTNTAVQGFPYFFKNEDVVKHAGVYRFEFVSAAGRKEAIYITVTAGAPTRIELKSASSKFAKGSEAVVAVSLYDKLGNIAEGQMSRVQLSLSGDGYFWGQTEENAKNINLSLVEGLATVSLKAKSAGTLQLTAHSVEGVFPDASTTVEALDNLAIRVSIEDENGLLVGSGAKQVSLSVRDEQGRIVDGFSGVASLSLPQSVGHLSTYSTTIENGKNTQTILLSPGIIAGANGDLEVSISGFSDVTKKRIVIGAGQPMAVRLSPSFSYKESKKNERVPFVATLVDAYGNKTTQVGSSFQATFSVPDEYRPYLHFDDGKYEKAISFSGGEAKIDGILTDHPGKAYVVVEVSPNLANNIFSYTNSQNEVAQFRGYGKNLAQIRTYYALNKEKLDKISYNGLYTFLLGADYGNVTQRDYLGGSVLFSSGSLAIAASSLLEHPSKKTAIARILSNGKMSVSATTDNPAALFDESISLTHSWILLQLADQTHWLPLLEETINTQDIAQKIACNTAAEDTVGACKISGDSESVFFNGIGDYVAKNDSGKLVLQNGGADVITFDEGGNWKVWQGISLDTDTDATGNILGFYALFGDKKIAYIGIKITPSTISTQTATSTYRIGVKALSPNISVRSAYTQDSTHDNAGLEVFLANEVDSSVLGENIDGADLGNYGGETTGIGWQGENKILLQLAAGATLWEATKFYQTDTFVNLGDPFYRVANSSNNKAFDTSVGKEIYQLPSGETLRTYLALDIDGDKKDDIVPVTTSGDVRMIKKWASAFQDLGIIAQLPNFWNTEVGGGMLDGNNYGDIAYTTSTGSLAFLMNNGEQFSVAKSYVEEESWSGSYWDIPVSRFVVSDMDKDGKDDIVTLTQWGELLILYGKGQKIGDKLYFSKKILDKGISVKFNSEISDPQGALFFSGMSTVFSGASLQDFSQEAARASSINFSKSNEQVPLDMQQAIVNNQLYYTEEVPANGEITDIKNISKTSAQSIFGTEMDNSQSSGENIESISATGGATTLNSVIEKLNTLGGKENSVDIKAQEQSTKTQAYLRSKFSFAEKVAIKKTYELAHSGSVVPGDIVKVHLKIENQRASSIKNIQYLDSLGSDLFNLSGTGYTVSLSGKEEIQNFPYETKTSGEFDLTFPINSLVPNQSVEIVYTVGVKPFNQGKILVGDFEKGEDGVDNFWDVLLKLGTNCASIYPVWRSISAREYLRGEKTYTQEQVNQKLEKNALDNNGNGTPDYVDYLNGKYSADDAQNYGILYFKKLSGGDFLVMAIKEWGDTTGLTRLTQENLSQYLLSANQTSLFGDSSIISNAARNLFTSTDSAEGASFTDISAESIQGIENQIDGFVKKLGCGFSSGGCGTTSPLNWAPLAPGSVPTLFGYPMGIMTPSTGVPVMSLLTGRQAMCGKVPCCLPSIFPATATAYVPGTACGLPSAGGVLGTWSPFNTFRLFITPTLTGGMGMAACFGGTSMVTGNMPPPGLSGLIPGGNCVVSAKSPSNSCGSSSPIQPMQNGFMNANQCSAAELFTGFTEEERNVIASYIQGDSGKITTMNNYASAKRFVTGKVGLFNVRVGNASTGNEYSATVDFKSIASGNSKNIVKINLPRTSAFPDFIMDWVSRQQEEIVNKLTTLPTLYVILPNLAGLQSVGGKDFLANTKKMIQIKQAKSAKNNTKVMGLLGAKTSNGTEKYGVDGVTKIKNDAGLSGVRSAFTLLSNLPFLDVKNKIIDVPIPNLSSTDIQKWDKSLEKTQKKWDKELLDKKTSWEKLGKSDEYKKNVEVNAKTAISTLEYNKKMIDQYGKFPQKLSEFFAWKEKYIRQVLCNVDAIENFNGKWLNNNGKRFKAWVQAFVLLKKALETWQVIPNLFTSYKASCSVCKNERYDLKHFIFKLISIMTPKVPVIQFPKWPDIILDVHDIQLGMTLVMPQFNIRPITIKLPNLPTLSLPSAPTIGLAIMIPNIPRLPSLPILPTLPNLPGLPMVQLPDLPPPPKIPKLFGSLSAVLNILKLWQKVLCVMRMNPFVPEWRAGDLIAQLTERTGTLPIDFLDIEFPKMSTSFTNTIRVKSSVKFDMQSDFLSQMAQSAVAPLKTFTPDLTNMFNITPKTIAPIQGLPSGNIKMRLNYGDSNKDKTDNLAVSTYQKMNIWNVAMLQEFTSILETDSATTMEVSDFAKYFVSQIQQLPAQEGKEMEVIQNNALAASQNIATPKEVLEAQSMMKEKYALIKDYVNQELIDTQELSRKVKEDINGHTENIKVFGEISSLMSNSARIKQDKVNAQAEKNKQNAAKAIEGLVAADMEKIGIEKQLITSSPRVNLLADNTSTNNIGTTTSVTNADDSTSLSNFSGIYVQTKEGTSEKLIDYTEEITADTEVISLSDGQTENKDVLYILGDGLFVKANNLNVSNKQPIEESFVEKDLDTFLGNAIGSPNYIENQSLSGSLWLRFDAPTQNGSYNGTYQVEYNKSLPFFWKMGGKQTTSSRVIELGDKTEPNENNEENTAFSGVYISSHTTTFGRAGGMGRVTYPNYKIVKEGERIVVGQGKEIYAGGSSLTISYTQNGNISDMVSLTIQPNQSVKMLEDSIVEIASGQAYIFENQTLLAREMDLTEIRGLPVLPGTNIEVLNKQGYLLIDKTDGTQTEISGGNAYSYIETYMSEDNVKADISEEPGFWYARVRIVGDNIAGTRSLPEFLYTPAASITKVDINANW